MVRKKFLRVKQMLTTVEQAQSWTDFLIRSEARGPGDTDSAMDRVARRYGVPRSTLWGLRYRPPKDLLASVYLRLRDAYEAEHERQIERLRHDLEMARQAGRADAPLVRAAAAMGGSKVEARK